MMGKIARAPLEYCKKLACFVAKNLVLLYNKLWKLLQQQKKLLYQLVAEVVIPAKGGLMTEQALIAKRAYQKQRRQKAKAAGPARACSDLSPEAREAKRLYEKKWRAANPDKVTATRERFYIRQAARAGKP